MSAWAVKIASWWSRSRALFGDNYNHNQVMRKCTKSHIQSSSNGVHCLLLPTQSKCDHLSPHQKSKTRCAKFPSLSLVCSFVHPPTPASNTQACPIAVFQGTASNATRAGARSLPRPLSGITPCLPHLPFLLLPTQPALLLFSIIGFDSPFLCTTFRAC